MSLSYGTFEEDVRVKDHVPSFNIYKHFTCRNGGPDCVTFIGDNTFTQKENKENLVITNVDKGILPKQRV